MTALENITYTHPPVHPNESDPMFRAFDPDMPELQVKTDAQLSVGEPDHEFAEYIASRNLNGVSESRKLSEALRLDAPSLADPSPEIKGRENKHSGRENLAAGSGTYTLASEGQCALSAHGPEGVRKG